MNKAGGGDIIRVELFKILKKDAVKSAALNMSANLKNSTVSMSVVIPIPKKSNAKECSKYHTIALISHASKVTLKILQARLQQYVNREPPDVQAGFRKGRNCQHMLDHRKIKRVSENHLFLLY